jgi:hypothetical protein
MPTPPSLPLWKRLLFVGIGLVGIPLAIVALLEGASSLVLFQRDLSDPPVQQLSERRHTTYDTLLGWVAVPEFYDPDLYGPGVSLRTNAQGFRADHAIAPHVPSGRTRAICSGDSYTLGWGVDNDHTWCHLLEQRIPGLETVNLGQGGYGVDQAYLWYRRDGLALDHDLQIFAVIAEDFERMRYPDFRGFGKPVLELEGDRLRVGNVPVRAWSYHWPRLAEYLYAVRPAFAHLRMSMLVTRLGHRLDRSDDRPDELNPEHWRVVERLLQDLASLNRAKHSRLVVVFLPMRLDFDGHKSDRWRKALAAAAARDGYRFVDLVEVFRRIPRDSLDALFLRENDYYSHYGNGGHTWAADLIAQRLHESPKVAAAR